MALILDTNALSASMDGDDAMRRKIEEDPVWSIPAIVLGEYLFGLRQSRWRAQYEQMLDKALRDIKVLPITQATAKHYANIRAELKAVGRPIPDYDLWIAAVVREHNLPLISRDKHFDAVNGLRRLAW